VTRVKAVLFDFWNTLFVPSLEGETYWRLRASYLKETLDNYGLRVSIDEVLSAIRARILKIEIWTKTEELEVVSHL